MVDYHVGLVRNFPKYNNVGSLPKELWYYKNNAFKIWIFKKNNSYICRKITNTGFKL